MKLKNYTGIVLAGGSSNRMGRDKTLLEFEGKSLIENSVSLLGSIFPEVIIIANETEKFQHLGIDVYKDIYTGVGPLAGIHSGLFHSKSENNFLIAADMPYLSTDLIIEICNYPTDKLISVVSIENRIEGLAGKYSQYLFSELENFISVKNNSQADHKKNKKNSLAAFIKNQDACIIENTKLKYFSTKQFFNVNNPDDYKLLKH